LVPPQVCLRLLLLLLGTAAEYHRPHEQHLLQPRVVWALVRHEQLATEPRCLPQQALGLPMLQQHPWQQGRTLLLLLLLLWQLGMTQHCQKG
jgi:hypothetical protein